jgi:hypothetical protein
MESSNLTPPSDDAWLEAWLNKATPAPLPDDGFSARVLAALPERASRRQSRHRVVLYASGVCASLGWALLVPGQWPGLPQLEVNFFSGFTAFFAHSWPTLWPSVVCLTLVYAFYIWILEESGL